MFELNSSESIRSQGIEVPVFNTLYMNNKGVLSAKRVAVYHTEPRGNLVYGHQIMVAADVFETPEEAVTAFEFAEARYADRIQHIKSAPGYHGLKLPKDYAFKVCFTGFNKADKAGLTELAEAASVKVVTGVSASLNFLCCGDNAVWSKMKRANELGGGIGLR